MKNISKLFLTFILSVGFLPAVLAHEPQESQETFIVGVAALRDNPDYNRARTAFVNLLEEKSDIHVHFKFLDASGDDQAYARGLERLVNEDKVDLIFTTGTRSTLPAVKMAKDVPLVFTAVADPVRSGIVESLGIREVNITGTHCWIPAYAQLKTILKVFPFVKTLGIVYTEGEPNAEIQLEDFQYAADQLNLSIITSAVSLTCRSDREVTEAAQEIIDKVELFIIFQDTSLARYGQEMITLALKKNIPTYSSLAQLLPRGALLCLGVNFQNLGLMAGQKAYQVLKNKIPPRDIPIDTDPKYLLEVNLKAAKELGVAIPIQVLRTASQIIR